MGSNGGTSAHAGIQNKRHSAIAATRLLILVILIVYIVIFLF